MRAARNDNDGHSGVLPTQSTTLLSRHVWKDFVYSPSQRLDYHTDIAISASTVWPTSLQTVFDVLTESTSLEYFFHRPRSQEEVKNTRLQEKVSPEPSAQNSRIDMKLAILL
ncbi:hypothetical protein M407DRAFT_19726 [Tulasnella calospora MUT 4182]|uniref:Uncharacterized protein n=1 Tax=Tulasnella calospora MUT 4182 TaxID=1051891 RepID=A0A0C3QHL9_9AGAM|nr:hypothetical protein M407DRAFT_19726 [Tulasnella calospora MUT 4182]